jgi:hypothetical protein
MVVVNGGNHEAIITYGEGHWQANRIQGERSHCQDMIPAAENEDLECGNLLPLS